MKYSKLYLFSFLFILNSCNCSKTTTSPNSSTEYPVEFSINVDPGDSGILAVVGTSQVINVNVSSQMPSEGLIIDVTASKDADNSILYSKSISTVSSNNIFIITDLKPGVLCTVKVVVTSKSSLSNTKTTTFKLAAK